MAHGVHGNSWMARPGHLPETEKEETWLTNRAMERLEKRDPTRPFFICLSFNGPHPPWCPPQSFFELFIEKDIPQPVVGEWAEHHAEDARYPLDVNAWRGRISPGLNHRARAAYYAYLAYIDAQIGRFVEFLGRRGMRGNTWFAFSSDHGEMLGDHNLWRKTYAYDPSARIPLILVPPGGWQCEKNLENDAPVGWEDIMPTFLEAAGADVPGTVEGASLLRLLRNPDADWRPFYHHEHSPCYHPENAYQSLVSRQWKYVWNPINGNEQLFRMADDPHELCDLAPEAEYGEELGRWRTRLAGVLRDRPEKLSDGEKLRTAEVPVWRDPR
jgi:arylsulfatase A-like enzyme